MDAWKARRRRGLLAVCAGIVLAGWTGGAVRAAEGPSQEDTSAEEVSVNGRRGVVITTEGGQADRLLAGMLAFNPPVVPPPPPEIPPAIPPDNPPPPDSPDTPIYPLDMAPDCVPPDVPPATSNPEPASLLIGLIGSACGGAATWVRRRKGRTVK